MTVRDINKIRALVKAKAPLIHCITNPISINQCANAILAAGARPIMAEHPDETAEITMSSQSLLLNLGNITDARLKSIAISAACAHNNKIPFVIDMVGTACSQLRRNFASELLSNVTPTVIKGNYSEINAVYDSAYKSSGVDSDPALDAGSVTAAAVKLARLYGCIVLASGKTDIITDGSKVFLLKNGSPQLAGITGTGCMLGALCAAFLSVSADMTAVSTACAVMGISGELAADCGIGTFMTNLLDRLSCLSDKDVSNNLKWEEIIP